MKGRKAEKPALFVKPSHKQPRDKSCGYGKLPPNSLHKGFYLLFSFGLEAVPNPLLVVEAKGDCPVEDTPNPVPDPVPVAELCDPNPGVEPNVEPWLLTGTPKAGGVLAKVRPLEAPNTGVGEKEVDVNPPKTFPEAVEVEVAP